MRLLQLLLALVLFLGVAQHAAAQTPAPASTTAVAPDSGTIKPADHTGPVAPLIDYWFPVAITFLQSLVLKGLAGLSSTVRNWSEPVKWSALFALGVVANYLSGALGLGVVAEAHTWAAPGILAAVQTVAAALIYKFGGHKVPATA